ncbi:MAG: LacI family DNA-binding transcriptional regulator [Actinobacteria bacterium]|nr:LacI family DNA-binding transcriptional regulator [Actinomycetota bacterium]
MKNNKNHSLKKRITIKNIAHYTGYSIATVSRVLNKKGIFYSNETYEKIQKAIKKLNYYPDAIARGLKTKRTYNIAFLEPFTSEFFSEIFLGVQDVANENGYSVAIFSSNYNKEQERRNIKSILSNRFDGIIVSSAILDKQSISKIVEEQMPLIIIEKFIENKKIPCVSIKNREVSKKAINFLISLGHKKIAFVSEPIKIGKLTSRFRGYKDALEDNNIKIDKSFVFIDIALRGEIYENCYNFFKNNLNNIKRCSAMFVTSDKVAISAIKALNNSGISVPDDISIIGFDGLEISKYINPSLTTIIQPRYEMGYKAMKMLLAIINRETVSNIELKAELITGESTIKLN